MNLGAVVALALALGGIQTFCRADEVTSQARAIYEKNSHGVVTVELVQKSSAGRGNSGPREAKQSVTGTVLDATGLTVVSLTTCDPSEFYRRLSEDFKGDVEITDVRLLLDDGTELPAEIVLRDKDLDLAFIRPKTKVASPMTSIDFKTTTTADLLDTVISLNRLKQSVGRTYSVSLERVASIVRKPRTFYVPDSSQSQTSLGCPAFALNGKVLGLFVMRAVSAAGAGNMRDCYSEVIIPAEDVLKGAAQAPEAHPDAPASTPAAETPASSKDTKDTKEAPAAPAPK